MISGLRTARALLLCAAAGFGLIPAPVFALGAQAALSPAPLAPDPDALAVQPDPHEFVTRTDGRLFATGEQFRFGGAGISTLGLRHDGSVPTEYEADDLFGTALALGIGAARVTSLGVTAGCAACLVPAPGQINATALRRADHLLSGARNDGIKIIIPLAGGSDTCPAQGAPDPLRDTACIFARARGLPPAAFYTDAAVRADFAAAVRVLLRRVNSESGIAYRNDSTILAWENCDGCGAGQKPDVIAAWTEFLGQVIKSADTHHVYENGAFAGRLASVGASLLALPSVDVLGDRIAGHGNGPDRFDAAFQAVSDAGRAYVVDSYDWTSAAFATPADLQAFFDAVFAERGVTGIFADDLYGHADGGGYTPPPAGTPPLYFPGSAVAGMDAADVLERGRDVRRMAYRMLGQLPPAYAKPPPPELISVRHGDVRWRGSAGAAAYSIERSADAGQDKSWYPVCAQCVTDEAAHWQDPAMPAQPAWYRLIPYNANRHAGLPSKPMQDTR